MHWYLNVLKKYAEFSGRARRKEYWFFQLFNMLFVLALMVVDGMTGTMRGKPGFGFGLLSGLYVLGVFLPSLGVLVRRLHDTGRSGWWFLIGLIPLVGPIILLVFALQDSHPGANQYGPNPKETLSGSMAGGGAIQAG
jgi:uncharacterized membrane protein YhaH (DUF805 family)